MVQKSILSFFASPKAKKPEGSRATGGQSKPKKEKEEEEKSVNSETEESPIKKKSTSTRRKSRVIESDSEDEEAPNNQPSTSSSPNKSDEEKENKVKKKLARFSIDSKDNDPKNADKDKEPKSKGKTPTKPEKEAKEKTNKKLKKDGDEEGKKGSGEEMETEEGKDEEGTKKEGKGDSNKVKGKKDDSEMKDGDEGASKDANESQSTPKRSSPSSSQLPTGFTPTTVPPLRKTARKQMKRKSDGMEEKQRAKVRKLKEENGSPSKDSSEKQSDSEGETEKKEKDEEKGSPSKDDNEGETEKKDEVEEKGSPVKDTNKKTDDSEEETEKQEDKDDGEEEPMEVDEQEEGKTDKKDEKTTPSRPKPAGIHSFFAQKPKKSPPSSPKKEDKEGSSPTTHKSPIKIKLVEEEEENCSSPMKKMKPEKKGKKKPQKKVATPKMKKEKDDDDNDASPKTKKGTPKTKKENGTPKAKKENATPKANKGDSKKKATTPKIKKEEDDDSESPKMKKEDSPKFKKEETSPVKTKKEEGDEEKVEKKEKAEEEKTKTEKKEEKVEKKPKINPFAPKPKTGGAKEVGADYNPGKKKYHPIDDAFWTRSQKVPYLALAKTMELIENTSGRLRTIEILANFLRSVIVLTPEDLLFCIYLCLNKVAPAFEGVELGVGETILMRTIAQASGRSVDMVKGDAEKQGDLGIVAEQSRSSQRLMFQPANLTLKGVFDKLKEIALMTGNSSQSRKIDKIKGMYVACRLSEARYLIRSLGGKLRIGLAEQSVLQALAQACFLTPPSQEYPPEVLDAGTGIAPDRLKAKIDNYGLLLKTTYCEFPSYDKIIPVLLTEGLEELPKHCQLTPGIPLKPMLAHPTTGVSEVLRRFENAKFTCEFKYDGERAQIHMKDDGSISIYSRNQEDNTTKYPDIIARFKNALGEDVKSCVIDSEAVAWDREKKQILPFQILSTRKRKDADEKDIKVQVCVFPFDLLYLNGEPMVKKAFEQRRALLQDNFKEVEGEFVFAKSMDSTNTEDIEEFLEESIKGNCEGLMVKTLDVDATYEIAKRSHNWLKLKKDYLDGVGDTIDVVVMGGYMGKGKRAGHYGGFLLACYDAQNEEYQTLCKIGTGFTDESLQKHSEFFKDHIIEKPKSYYRYENNIAPDHWFEPVQVWEIKCADLSISPVHKAAAGIVDPEKGISLRFPRFLRIREDKTPEDATSASQIADLYNNQDQIKNKKAAKNDDEEFY